MESVQGKVEESATSGRLNVVLGRQLVDVEGISFLPAVHLCDTGAIPQGELCGKPYHQRLKIDKKLDQGALGMSDPLGPLQLALKPNSASSINRPLLNFYYCAH